MQLTNDNICVLPEIAGVLIRAGIGYAASQIVKLARILNAEVKVI